MITVKSEDDETLFRVLLPDLLDDHPERQFSHTDVIESTRCFLFSNVPFARAEVTKQTASSH